MVAIYVLALFSLCLFYEVSARPVEEKTLPLNVHLVPHTHDDVGWLKTVDEYYYGAKNQIQHAAVQYIITTVVDELLKNKDRKFIYVEIAFFIRWWNEQTDDVKQQVHGLVANGQLEFINGGWCMNDEASTHYNAIIDQMSLGLRFLSNTFGIRPVVGWHIDPFGHSSFQATAFSLIGFDSMFFARNDYADKALRLNTSQMEMIWEGSQSLGNVADIFTGVLYHHYVPPPGFCFDSFCSDPPIMDDDSLFDDNVKERVNDFVKASLDQAKHYKTNNIMMTMGSDFQYENAYEWFSNLDKLIKYVNMNGSINAMYSTPSMYVDAINKETNLTWTTKTDDFFPYADAPHNYWTGYFTSRPAIKGYVRMCNAHLQACKQLEAVHNGMGATGPSSVTLQHAMGVAQHHDAVSGTEKQHVADDYAKRLHIGEVECRSVMAAVLNDLAAKDSNTPKMNLSFCEYLNISVCPVTEGGDFSMVIYNSLARPYTGMVRVPVIKEGISVTDPDGNTVTVQIVPNFPINNDTFSMPFGSNITSVIDAVFEVTDVPPLGYAIYTAKTTGSLDYTQKSAMTTSKSSNDVIISNKYYQVEFDGQSGQMKKITNMVSGTASNVEQQFYWYNGSAGNNKNSTQKSGAYIFRPNSSALFPVGDTTDVELSIIEGDLVSEVWQVFGPWVYQVVRLYKNKPFVELEYTVGPIDVRDDLGKEVISHFKTDLKTDSTFYTDANGRDTQKRVKDFRPTWKYNNTEPIAGNYYPVNSRIFLRDEAKKVQFTLLTDRSQGGSSLDDGAVELMVHRRLLYDDDRGVGEPLNETGVDGKGLVIRGKHLLILDTIDNSAHTQRMMAEELMMIPELAFTEDKDLQLGNYNLKYSGLSSSLPDNVHLLTLEYLDQSTILLRLDHQFESDDPQQWSAPVTVKLSDLFVAFKIKEVTELGLGGNVVLSDIKKLQWKTVQGQTVPSPMNFPPVTAPDFNVTLSPMMIRTFNVTVDFSSVSPFAPRDFPFKFDGDRML